MQRSIITPLKMTFAATCNAIHNWSQSASEVKHLPRKLIIKPIYYFTMVKNENLIHVVLHFA